MYPAGQFRVNKGRSSKFREVPEFEKPLKKAGRHIGRNIVEITIKMKTIVRKALMIKLKLICLHTGIAIVSTQLIGFNYCYLTFIILFNNNHLFSLSEVVTSIDI